MKRVNLRNLPALRLWGRRYILRKRDVEQLKRFIERWEAAYEAVR